MGLEEVKKEIIEKAKREADAILKDADKEAKEIVTETKDKIEQYKKDMDVQQEARIAGLEKVYSASANAAAKGIILEKKKEIIISAFDEAAKIIAKQSKSRKYIEKLLAKAQSEIEISTVYCNKQDVSGIAGFKAMPENISGGVIAENKEGTIKVDLSYDSILADIKAKNLHEIAEILFTEK